MKLNATQRRAIFLALEGKEKFPNLAGEGDAPVSAGHTFTLSSRVEVKVRQVDRPSPNRWQLAYTVYDFRDEPGLARTGRKVALDDHGNAVPMTEHEELGYGGNPRFGLDAGRRVSRLDQKKLSDRADAEWSQYVTATRPDEIREREMLALFNQARRVHKEALKKGVDLREQLADFVESARAEIRDT